MTEIDNAEINLLLTLPIEQDLLERLEAYSSLIKLHHYPTRDPDDIPDEVWEQTEVLYTLNTLPLPEKAPNLKWIQFHLAGIESELAQPIARKDNVMVTNMSGVNASQVSEYVLAMFLALSRNIPQMIADKNEKIWHSRKGELYTPRELRGSTVGIVGYGSIGRQIARLLQPFSVQILASKANAMDPVDKGFSFAGQGDPEGDLFTRLYPQQALKTMLKDCDFVAVTVPKTPQTNNLINKKHFEAMKETAFIVDISRGGVIDHDALYKALEENQIAGAALDVFPMEPLPESDPIWDLPNLIISPHIAGYSSEYNNRAIDFFLKNINNYLTESELFNLVELDKGY